MDDCEEGLDQGRGMCQDPDPREYMRRGELVVERKKETDGRRLVLVLREKTARHLALLLAFLLSC